MRLLVAWGVRKQKTRKHKENWGALRTSLILGVPFLIPSWDRTKAFLLGHSLSALGAHFQVWGCSEFKPGEYHWQKYGKLTGLVVLQILVFPTLPATVDCLESSRSCFVRSLQVLELHLPGQAGGVCLLHPIWSQNQKQLFWKAELSLSIEN